MGIPQKIRFLNFDDCDCVLLQLVDSTQWSVSSGQWIVTVNSQLTAMLLNTYFKKVRQKVRYVLFFAKIDILLLN